MNPLSVAKTKKTSLRQFRTLIVCRGPIAMEALEMAAELEMPPPHIIVSKREVYESAPALAPWVEHHELYERLHIVDDYRDQEAILSIALANDLRGIYVGYGLNAENAEFIGKCEAAGLAPVAPPSSVMAFTASKFQAKKWVRDELGIRVLPGSDRPAELAMKEEATDEQLIGSVEKEVEAILKLAPNQIIRLKAVQGGGGKGQRLVTQAGQAAGAVRQIWAEISARGKNGDKGILVEANLAHPRHWEVQTFSDGETFVHFGARECSIQNSGSQKFIEVGLHPRQFDSYLQSLEAKRDAGLIALLKEEEKRIEEVCDSAVRIMRSLKYRGAATVEFLVAEDGGPEIFGKPHFMEINSRIQVEHRVSEAVARVRGKTVRLVGEQFRVAAGEKLGYAQEDISFAGYSTELRINASNPNFLIGASGSVIERYNIPATSENFYYDDGGAAMLFEEERRQNWAVPNFDSNFGLAVFIGGSQTESLDFARRALEEFEIRGNRQLLTTRPFHLGVLSLLGASAPYGKIRTDFSEIMLAFGALIYHALAKIKASEIKANDPLHRLLAHALRALQREPGLAIALGFYNRRREQEGKGIADLLLHLARLIQLPLFREEKESIENSSSECPPILGKILAAVESSGIYEFRREEANLEFFIPENVRNPRERQILIEELRDATVQAIALRHLSIGEVDDLKRVLNVLQNKMIEHVGDATLLNQLSLTLNACVEMVQANSHMPPSAFEAFYENLHRVKWAIRKGSLAAEVELLLLTEVNRAIRVVRGPNVVAHLAGTIFLKPSPDKPSFVRVGDEVREDETVLALLENMKMFNEIRSHMTGRIREICVENERPVLPGDILVVIE